jgi:predicted TIM-barrel fold metal-dependent hydrolase
MNATLEKRPIIDIDTHWTEPRDLWTKRTPSKLEDRVPRLALDAQGNEQWFVEDDILLGGPGYSVIKRDGSKAYGTFSLPRFEDQHEGGYNAEARLKVMDQTGIYAEILYPNTLGFAGGGIMKVKDLELRNFCIRAYNDGCGELQQQGKGRLFPQAVLPFWDLDFTLRELKRCREELGLIGFTMTDSPQEWNLPPLHNTYWDGLWGMAQDYGMPINFHIGSGQTGPLSWPEIPPDRMLAVSSTCIFLNNIRCMVNLIFSGLLDRFPTLNFVSVESGVGWIPVVIESCNYQMRENMAKPMKLSPAEYLQRQIYSSYWFEKNDLCHSIEMIGEDHVMFETDFPHPTCIYPNVQETIEGSIGKMADRVQRKVLWENASRVYGIPLPR